MSKKIFISGIGVLSPLGIDLEDHIDALKSGKCGIGFNSADIFPRAAGFIPDFKPADYIENKKSIRYMTSQIIYGSVSAIQAMRDAGISKEFLDASEDENGIIYGAGIGSLVFESQAILVPCLKEDNSFDYDVLGNSSYRDLPPLWIVPRMANAAAGQISIQNLIKGINYTIDSGANSGLLAIGESFEAIKCGRAERMVCGASEWSPALGSIYKLEKMGYGSNSDKGSRPFSTDSEGLLVSEAGVTLILESEDEILKRNGKKYARIAGYKSSFVPGFPDAASRDLVPHYEKIMLSALAEEGLKPSDVDFIQSAACGVNKMDEAEAMAISNIFGSKVAVTSACGATGFALSASGSLAAAYAVLQMENNFIAPIIRSEKMFLEGSLNYIKNQRVDAETECCLCNSFDFFGNASSMVFRK